MYYLFCPCSTGLYRMYLLDCNASVIGIILFPEIAFNDHFQLKFNDGDCFTITELSVAW